MSVFVLQNEFPELLCAQLVLRGTEHTRFGPVLCTESTRRESLTSFRRAGHQKSTAAALRCHSLIGGETEIRTRDTLLEYTRFPGVPLKPLEHLSNGPLCFWDCKYRNISQNPKNNSILLWGLTGNGDLRACKHSAQSRMTRAADGCENFTFELLEVVPKDKLRERESYYIDFYDSKTYGLNSVTGDKNK